MQVFDVVNSILIVAQFKLERFYYEKRQVIYLKYLLKICIGYLFFDYVQDILFDRCHLFRPLINRPITSSIDACNCLNTKKLFSYSVIFQIRLLSTWGDEFYIGLNGIELYNRKDAQIRLKLQSI